MVANNRIPEHLNARAQRRVWFERQDAETVLDWIEDSGQRFLGLDVAQRNDDDSWTLLLDSLDLSGQTDNLEAVRRGRVFIRENAGEGRMFEPVWEGRSK